MENPKATIVPTAAQSNVHTTIDPVLLEQGLELIRLEKEMSFRQAIRLHWRAVVWSCILSLALVMDGFDGAIINSFYSLPSFKEKFGDEKHGVKSIPTNWQTAYQTIGIPGSFIGLFLCGWCQERFGSRRTYMSGMAACVCVVFLFVFAQSKGMLLGTEAIAAGIWSLFNTLTAAYAAEVCPIQLRGYATSFISFCWGSGSFIASGVNRAALAMDEGGSSFPGWRMAYCIQWVWPVPLLIAAYFAPESPWWLVRHGHTEQAKKTLVRIATPGYWDSHNLDAYIAVIKHTDEMEKAEAATGSFWDLWRGTNRRRTEIEGGVWAIQVFSGTAMTSYAVQFLKGAGMSTDAAFNFNIIISAMNLVGCFCEFGLISRFGRRPLILTGLVVLAVSLMIIGILGSVEKSHSSMLGIGTLCAVINLVYHASVGPLTYTIASEVPASRIRARTVAWGRAVYVILYNATSQLTPRMVNPSTTIGSWGWGAKAAFFWLGGNLAITTWAYFRMPETGGFSFAELDILFANKVSARKFTSVKVQDMPVQPEVEHYDQEVMDGKEKMETQHVEQRGTC